MRFPNDTAFHLRLAALLVAALFLEHLAATHVPHWSSPEIGIVTFVLGLAWVALAAYQHAKATQDRIRVLEAKLDRLSATSEALADELRARRSLPRL
jgi:GAF domain-containing protein